MEGTVEARTDSISSQRDESGDADIAAARRRALQVVERYSIHPSGYLAINEETMHFTVDGLEGMIAYRPQGGYLFQFGGVIGPQHAQPVLLREFRAMAQRDGKRVCAVELRTEDIELYREAGFTINQFGSSYSLDLTRFTDAGTRFMKMRNKIKRARRAGIVVSELGGDVARTQQAWDRLDDLSERWLKTKGRHAKMLRFLIGEVGTPNDLQRRIFVAEREDQLVGFISYVPAYGRFAGVMHDLSRRVREAPPGTMELINVTALQRFQSEGINYLNFGLTPFSGLSDQVDNIEGRSTVVSRVLKLLAKHGQSVYPADSQVRYKLKWQPQTITPEYVAFDGGFRWSCMWQLLMLTRAI